MRKIILAALALFCAFRQHLLRIFPPKIRELQRLPPRS